MSKKGNFIFEGGKGKEGCQILMRIGWQRERRVPNFNETVLVETPFMYIVYKVYRVS